MEGIPSADFNVLAYFLLAGFEVTIIGRFWVTAEAGMCEKIRRAPQMLGGATV
jgi:hypothetical protein